MPGNENEAVALVDAYLERADTGHRFTELEAGNLGSPQVWITSHRRRWLRRAAQGGYGMAAVVVPWGASQFIRLVPELSPCGGVKPGRPGS